MNPIRSILFAALAAILIPESLADVPQIINYQGRIHVGATPFTGTGQFRFALVNMDGTTTYWSNDGSSAAGSEPTAAVSLPVANGLYVVPLGDITITNMQAVPATVFTHDDVRLRVWFDDGSNGSQMLSPDQRITSVAYAMAAASLSTPTAPSPPTATNEGTVYFNSTDKRLYYSDGTGWLPAGNSQAVYRWAVWSTFHPYGSGWYFGNDPSMTGGVPPSNWSDGHATANQISPDKQVQATLFNKKAAISPSSVVWAEDWYSSGGASSRHAGALFRVRNTTGSDIPWTFVFSATAYPNWGERASVSINGASTWVGGGTLTAYNINSVVLSVPANRVSTVICVAGSGPPGGPNASIRSCALAFRNNCLTLPAGLEFVDDLDTATGGYEQ